MSPKNCYRTLMIVFVMAFALSLLLSGCSTGDGKDGSSGDVRKEIGQVEPDPKGTLSPFTLSKGVAKDGTINYVKVDQDRTAQYWNAEDQAFEDVQYDDKLVKGNFVRLIDQDGNQKADRIQVVGREDSTSYWDADMAWAEGAGTKCEPAVDDETAIQAYGDESTIPYGERLLAGGGIQDQGGATDFQNDKEIKYFSHLDWYNMLSSDTLAMLPHYRTYQQPDSCSAGCSAVLAALDWYGCRGDLNNYDIAMLRDMPEPEMETPAVYMPNIFKNLQKLGITGEWEMMTSMEEPDKLYDGAWIKEQLKQGHPIMVEYNAFGWHWQTIIGYEDMGTELPLDDVCIVMDSYDSTDGDNDGYYLESYLRLANGVCTETGKDPDHAHFICAWPADWTYEQEMGEGPAPDETNVGIFTEDTKIPYGSTAADIKKYYADALNDGRIVVGKNGLGGPASSDYYRKGDHDHSAYYRFQDFYNLEDSDTLHMLTHFQTLQQATEFSCGPAAAAMVMNWYGKLEGETDVSLMHARQKGRLEATPLKGMKEIFKYMNRKYDQDWVWVSTSDLDDPDGEESYLGDYCLQAGDSEDRYGLIPYLLDHDIPVMIGWDEWGGHWQVIIGYDDMGTPDRTQDDVIILADCYEDTDHDQDGYDVDGFERLVYGFTANFEKKYKHNDFLAAFPAEGHEDVIEALK